MTELLSTSFPKLNVEWIESDEITPIKSRAKTLSVSAVLEYPNTALLHASVMVEGNKDTHDNQHDYAADLFKDIQELVQNP